MLTEWSAGGNPTSFHQSANLVKRRIKEAAAQPLTSWYQVYFYIIYELFRSGILLLRSR